MNWVSLMALRSFPSSSLPEDAKEAGLTERWHSFLLALGTFYFSPRGWMREKKLIGEAFLKSYKMVKEKRKMFVWYVYCDVYFCRLFSMLFFCWNCLIWNIHPMYRCVLFFHFFSFFPLHLRVPKRGSKCLKGIFKK